MVIYMEEMKRGLKTRHISMIAIGGSIGTGLFMASGAVITQAGPAGALIAYAIILNDCYWGACYILSSFRIV